jgi:hypothetical protein
MLVSQTLNLQFDRLALFTASDSNYILVKKQPHGAFLCTYTRQPLLAQTMWQASEVCNSQGAG